MLFEFERKGRAFGSEWYDMEKLTSRKNPLIRHLRLLGSDTGYRTEQGEYVLDGVKLLRRSTQFCGQGKPSSLFPVQKNTLRLRIWWNTHLL